MKEYTIKCPNCNEVFSVDESSMAAFIQQVRTQEFENELKAREESLKRRYEAEAAAEKEKALSAEKEKTAELEKRFCPCSQSLKRQRQKQLLPARRRFLT